jgi:hypothetical protein
MHPTLPYELMQARIAGLHHPGRRDVLAGAARSGPSAAKAAAWTSGPHGRCRAPGGYRAHRPGPTAGDPCVPDQPRCGLPADIQVREIAMTAMIAAAAVGLFAAGAMIGIITVVSVAIRREERNLTLTRAATGNISRAGRWLNGVYVRVPLRTAPADRVSAAPLTLDPYPGFRRGQGHRGPTPAGSSGGR